MADDSIIIFEGMKPTVGSDGRPIQVRGGIGERFQEATNVGVAQLEENFSNFLKNMRQILEKAGAAVGGFQVDRVEIEAMISADGKVGLAGSSVGLSGKSSLKLVLTRQKE